MAEYLLKWDSHFSYKLFGDVQTFWTADSMTNFEQMLEQLIAFAKFA